MDGPQADETRRKPEASGRRMSDLSPMQNLPSRKKQRPTEIRLLVCVIDDEQDTSPAANYWNANYFYQDTQLRCRLGCNEVMQRRRAEEKNTMNYVYAGCAWGFGLTLGCSLQVGGVNACDFRADDQRCQERTGTQASPAFEPTCQASEGAFLNQACPREGIVGGCKISNDVVDWYYAPRTEEQVRSECRSNEFVRP